MGPDNQVAGRRVGIAALCGGVLGSSPPRGHRWEKTLTLLASGRGGSAFVHKIERLSTCGFPLQVGQMTQAGLLEHLKLENVSLSHQLSETQHRSIKEKERIALQLQGIEVGGLHARCHACGHCF